MKIYSGLVGPHAIDIPDTITGQVLPCNLRSDFGFKPTQTWKRITPDAVRAQLTHPSKLAYIKGASPDTFSGLITLQDAGYLTRALIYRPSDCEPYAKFVQGAGHLNPIRAYLDRVRDFTADLAYAIREVFPCARLIACEAHDLTFHNAVSDEAPHPEFRSRQWRIKKDTPWPEWEIGTSLYRNGENDSEYKEWVTQSLHCGNVVFLTPKANGADEVPDRFSRSVESCRDWFREVVIWGNPTSPEDAQRHAAIASEAVRKLPEPTTGADR